MKPPEIGQPDRLKLYTKAAWAKLPFLALLPFRNF